MEWLEQWSKRRITMKIIRRIICAVVGHGKSYRWARKAYYREGSRFVESTYTRFVCTRCGMSYFEEEKK
jgi:ribosomal protein L37E